uniref:ATP synthase F0 subunit 8 n=1 Tax=Acropyga arnoldi TaxID=354292 RepID=A0A6G5NHX4_9HYME|nr:ATP synthase F0 subunit 8 [Acropyga arnoldi]
MPHMMPMMWFLMMIMTMFTLYLTMSMMYFTSMLKFQMNLPHSLQTYKKWLWKWY